MIGNVFLFNFLLIVIGICLICIKLIGIMYFGKVICNCDLILLCDNVCIVL